MQSVILSTIVLLASSQVITALVPPIQCRLKDPEYRNIKVSNPYNADPHIVSGAHCQSDDGDTCPLGESKTYTVGVTKTVSGGVNIGLDIEKVFHIGADAGFSYAWSTSDASSTSAGVTCPKGHISCGMQAVAKLIDTTGQARRRLVNSDKKECHLKAIDWTEFKITGAYVEGNDAPDAQKPYVTYRACASECGTKETGPCPSDLPKCFPK